MPDLHEELASVYDQVEAAESGSNSEVDTPDVSAAPAADTPAAAPESPPEGKDAGTPPPSPVPPDAPGRTAKDAVVPETPHKGNGVDKAPATWKGEAKAVWDAVPAPVRQEINRREREINRSLQEHAHLRQTMESVNQTVAPYADLIQRNYGGSPAKAVQSLFEVERILTTAPTAQKAQFVANLIKHYGVDVQALDGFLVGQASPEHKQQLSFQQMLDQRLAPVMSYVQQQQQLQQQHAQQIDQEAVTTVEQMAQDTTNYPYFTEVKDDMADLIDVAAKRGLYLSLPEAYTRAVRLNDLTFDATTAQAAQVQAQKAQQQAQAAKAASASVSGSPVPQPTTPADPHDLHALLSSTYDNMMSGGRV